MLRELVVILVVGGIGVSVIGLVVVGYRRGHSPM